MTSVKKEVRIARLCFGAILLFFIICTLNSHNVYAESRYKKQIGEVNNSIDSISKYGLESQYLTEWLKKNGLGMHNVSNPKELYSVEEKIVAIYFDIDNTGYIIINAFDYDVMEYSLSSKVELQGYSKLYYTDFLSIYGELDKSRLQDCYSKKVISSEAVKTIDNEFLYGDRKSIVQREYALSKQSSVAYTNSGNNTYHESGSLKNSLARWYTGYYCHVNAAVIVLKYLYDNKGSYYLPTGVTSDSAIAKYLCDNRYLVNAGMNAKDAVDGGKLWERKYVGSQMQEYYTTGINQYLRDRRISGSSAYWTSYSFQTIETIIDNDKPVVVGCDKNVPGATWHGDHAIVAHGYYVGYDRVPYLYINNNVGRNGITINASSRYFTGRLMWYIN
ncbi:MAG: hypothetical protein J5717_11330 [Lachnospiraceae bacterium]|nr:hypothetical protein [Lachnospiraceae bacterium]